MCMANILPSPPTGRSPFTPAGPCITQYHCQPIILYHKSLRPIAPQHKGWLKLKILRLHSLYLCSPTGGIGNTTLSCAHGVVKAGVAIFQVLYGSWELYIARGRQFEKYGYSAFSLTLVPYIGMSLLNLLAAILEPQYPCVFLVQHGGDAPVPRDEINGVMGGAVAVGTADSRDGVQEKGAASRFFRQVSNISFRNPQQLTRNMRRSFSGVIQP